MEPKSGQAPKQLRLWDQLIPDPMPPLKAAMGEAIRNSPLSREQICEHMANMCRLAGITCNGKAQQVTVAVLDKWVAPSAVGHMIPLRLLHIFCRVVDTNLPFEVYAACFRNVRVVSEDAYRILQWAMAEMDARKARKQAKRRAQEVGLE